MDAIYMDHAATTPLDPNVIDEIYRVNTTVFGNPSSIHSFGRQARQYVDEARHTMAQSINAQDKEIIFTSGGTEADNLALMGTAFAQQDKGHHIITTMQEHHAALHTAQQLEQYGFEVTYLPVDDEGMVTTDDLSAALRPDTILVSVMYVNNETGVIQPIEEMAALLNDHQAYFHTDAVQAYGLLDMDVQQLGVDLLSVSAHKINGPKGIGFLYVNDYVNIIPLQHGGQQERKRRGGTHNTAGIAGFKIAVDQLEADKDNRIETYRQFKALFLETLSENNVSYTVNGNLDQSAPSIVNISFPKTHVETVLVNLDLEGVAAASGSACTAGSVEPSHVLGSMYQQDDPRITNSVRFSFGMANTMENVAEAGRRTAKVMQRLTKGRGDKNEQ